MSFASSVADPSSSYRVIDVRFFPDYDRSSLKSDLALLLLETSVSVRPFSVEMLAAAAFPAQLTLIGFAGLDKPVNRRSSGTVAAPSPPDQGVLGVEPSPACACHGDSGGALVNESGALVAVVSAGSPQCTGRFTGSVWTSDRLAFLRTYILDSSQAADPGGRCFFDKQCKSGSCRFPADAPARGYCAPRCTPERACPHAMHCEPSGDCGFDEPSPGALGDTCRLPWDCGRGVCARSRAHPDSLRCLRPCSGPDLGCGDNQRCITVEPVASEPTVKRVCVAEE